MSLDTTDIAEINFGSINAAGTGLRDLDPSLDDLGPAVGAALELSPTRAHRMVRGLVDTASGIDQAATEITALVEWSARAGSNERRVIIDAMRTSGGDVLLVDRMARLPRTEARPFMAEFLAAGGRTRDVATWLATVGGVLRSHARPEPGTSGGVIEWIGDTAEDAVDAIGEAVESVVDALVDAGESIADVIGAIVDFTAEQMANLVEALIEAGETVAGLIVDAVEAGAAIVTKTVRALIDIGRTVAEVLGEVIDAAADVLRATVDALRAIGESFIDIVRAGLELAAEAFTQVVGVLIEMGRTIVQLIGDAVAIAASALEAMVVALRDLGRSLASIIGDVVAGRISLLDALVAAALAIGDTVTDVLDAATDAVVDAVRAVAAALVRVGAAVIDLVAWAANAAIDTARLVVRGLLDAGLAIVDLVAALASASLSVMRTLVDGLFAIGMTLGDLLLDLTGVAVDLLAGVLEAAFDLGSTVLDFIAVTLETTYDFAKDFVEAAIEAGIDAAELLLAAAEGTYFVLRRTVFGLLDVVGLGGVLDWAAAQIGGAIDDVFREVVLAVRFAGAVMTEVLDWAADQTDAIFQRMVETWESVGEDLIELYRWAAGLGLDAAALAWERIGQATLHLANSVTYVLNYLENDFVPGARRFVRGLMNAGYELGDLLARVLGRTVDFVAEVLTELLELGTTLVVLLTEAAADPEDAMDRLVEGLLAAEQTWADIMAAAEQAGEDVVAEVAATARRLEGPLADMLDAAWEVGGGLFGLVVSQLFNALATYRPLTEAEKTEARLVFADSIDLDLVSISQESLDNVVIFEVQAFFQRLGGAAASARPFVSGTLINIDASVGITMPTLIHELTHVWQNFEVGPVYMSEAIHAQVTDPDAYDYGYDDATNGEGGQDELDAAGGDFEAFNREQQGDILEHYYVRTVNGDDVTSWQPYVDLVQAA